MPDGDRLVIEGTDKSTRASKPDPTLTKAVARAHKRFDDLTRGLPNSPSDHGCSWQTRLKGILAF